MNRRYLAVLATAACLVLGAGLWVRQRLDRNNTPVPAAPPSEATALQQLSQENEFRRMGAYVAERVAAAAAFVAYVPGTGASGVRWGGGTVVSTSASRAVVAGHAAAGDTLGSAPTFADTLASDAGGHAWTLVVGRRADGGVVSAAGLWGGRTTAACAGRTVQQYVVGAPLTDAFAGAGVFDLAGRALGVVVRCDGRLAALSVGEIRRLLADAATEPPAPDASGLGVAPLSAAARTYFGTDSGLLVTAVRRGGAAATAGLRAGDVVLAVDGRPVTTAADLAPLSAPGDSAERHVVTRRRGRAVGTVRMPSPGPVAAAAGGTAAPGAGAADVGIGLPPATAPRGVAITTVQPGSRAGAAGLRPGDRLLRVGPAPVATAADAERRLAAAGAALVFVAFDRDSVERGVLLPGAP